MRVGDSFALTAFLAIGLRFAPPDFFDGFLAETALASAGSVSSESSISESSFSLADPRSPSELLGCPSAVCVSESSASSSSACREQRVEARGRQPKATRRHCDAGPYVVGGLGWSVAHRSGAGEDRRGEGDAHGLGLVKVAAGGLRAFYAFRKCRLPVKIIFARHVDANCLNAALGRLGRASAS